MQDRFLPFIMDVLKLVANEVQYALMQERFVLLGIALVIAALMGFLSRRFKQPLILGYIVTGFLLGPAVFGLISDAESVQLLSEMGITFLLFTVGLHMSIDNLTELGVVSMVTGTAQVLVMTAVGVAIGKYYGFSNLASFYLGIAIAFSSTIIIVKMLSEQSGLNALYGKISIGFLLVQDFFAILAIVLVSGVGTQSTVTMSLLHSILKIVLFGIGAVALTKWIVPPVFDSAAENNELLFLTSISYCFFLAVATHLLGLSVEAGAFVAGVSLASLPYNTHIENKVQPLRDFLIVIFFITLGAEMAFSLSPELIVPTVLLSLVVLLGTPLVILTTMGLLGYRKRTSFLVGVTCAQISEFSLVLINLGQRAGHIGTEIISIVTGVGVVTIILSTYMMKYNHQLYHYVEDLLDVFEREEPLDAQSPAERFSDHVVVVGYHRVGYGIVHKLLDMDEEVLVVDFDPNMIKTLKDDDIPCLFGDIGDPEVIDHMNLEEAEMLISTAPNTEDNVYLLREAKELNPDIIVIIVAEEVQEALDLYEEGADYVVLPHLLGGHHASLLLEDITTDIDNLIEAKVEHIEELQERSDAHEY